MSDKVKKRNLVINGCKADDDVVVLGSGLQEDKVMKIRQVGVVGFYVKGLATCFYWHEKEKTWDDLARLFEPCLSG